MADQSHLYTGVWTSYSGPLQAKVLTVSDNDAFILVTLLTVIIPISIKSFWTAACATLWKHVPLPIQRQNAVGKFDDAGYLHVMINFPRFALRRARLSIDTESAPWPILFAIWIFTFLCFGTSLGLPIGLSVLLTNSIESPIVRASGTVRNFVIPVLDGVVQPEAAMMRNLNLTLAAADYYQTCYAETTTLSCKSNLVVDRLTWEEADVDCPFEASACLGPDHGAHNSRMRLETPWISLSELGINTPSRLHLKKAIECSILNATAFQPSSGFSPPGAESGDFSLSFGSTSRNQYIFRNTGRRAPAYRLTSISENSAGDRTLFDPRLLRPDGAVAVIVLEAPGVGYLHRVVDDPMFQATAWGGEYWEAAADANAAACVDQYIVCNNATGNCDPWVSVLAPGNAGQGVVASEEDATASQLLTYALEMTKLHDVIAGRGAGALQAQRSISGRIQYAELRMPWANEVRAWFGISLAKLQLNILSIGHPTSWLNTDEFTNFQATVAPDKLADLSSRILSREADFTNLNFDTYIGTITAFAALLVIAEVAKWFLHVSPLRKKIEGAGIETAPNGQGANTP